MIRKTAIKTLVPEEHVELIIKNSFRNGIKALAYTDITEIEIPGFGNIKISEAKLRRRLEKYYDIRQAYEQKLEAHNSGINILDIETFSNISKRLNTIRKDIVNLEKKFNRLKS